MREYHWVLGENDWGDIDAPPGVHDQLLEAAQEFFDDHTDSDTPVCVRSPRPGEIAGFYVDGTSGHLYRLDGSVYPDDTMERSLLDIANEAWAYALQTVHWESA